MKQQKGEKIWRQSRNDCFEREVYFYRKSSVRVLPQLCSGKENDRTSEQNLIRETDTKLNLRNKRYPPLLKFPWSSHHDCPAIHTNTRTQAHARAHTHTHTHTHFSVSILSWDGIYAGELVSIRELLMFTGYLPHRHEVDRLIICVSPVDLSFITMELSQELRRVEGKWYFLFWLSRLALGARLSPTSKSPLM